MQADLLVAAHRGRGLVVNERRVLLGRLVLTVEPALAALATPLVQPGHAGLVDIIHEAAEKFLHHRFVLLLRQPRASRNGTAVRCGIAVGEVPVAQAEIACADEFLVGSVVPVVSIGLCRGVGEESGGVGTNLDGRQDAVGQLDGTCRPGRVENDHRERVLTRFELLLGDQGCDLSLSLPGFLQQLFLQPATWQRVGLGLPVQPDGDTEIHKDSFVLWSGTIRRQVLLL